MQSVYPENEGMSRTLEGILILKQLAVIKPKYYDFFKVC